MKKWFTVFAMGMALLFEGAVEAQTLKAYMSFSPAADKVAVDMIKKKYGINITFIHLSYEEMEAKMKAEAPNFHADMILGCGYSLAKMAKENDWSVPYLSPEWTSASTLYADKQGHWVNPATCSFGIVGNQKRLTERGYIMPTSWKDLLDPKWKKEIVAPSPLSSGIGFLMRATFLTVFGEKGGWEYIEELNKNINHYARGANATTELVGRGEFLLGIASDEQIKLRQSEGYPIVFITPSEGVSFQGTYSMILKTCKDVDAAKKVIDFIGLQEFSDYMGSMGYSTVSPSINALYGKSKPKFAPVDLNYFIANKAKHNDRWKEVVK